MARDQDRRRKPRVGVQWPVSILADHGTVLGETKNITIEGLFIRCDEPLRIDETYRMAIAPPDEPAIGFTGRIVWSDFYGIGDDSSAYGIGICLVEISDEDFALFRNLIAQHAEE
ncbi:MAG: PilZ domain-containing protein [Deltaproteobacteria bacterium]|nr:PilZ domain-containing protein [Deltaproteobacteria bacterium]